MGAGYDPRLRPLWASGLTTERDSYTRIALTFLCAVGKAFLPIVRNVQVLFPSH